MTKYKILEKKKTRYGEIKVSTVKLHEGQRCLRINVSQLLSRPVRRFGIVAGEKSNIVLPRMGGTKQLLIHSQVWPQVKQNKGPELCFLAGMACQKKKKVVFLTETTQNAQQKNCGSQFSKFHSWVKLLLRVPAEVPRSGPHACLEGWLPAEVPRSGPDNHAGRL